MASDEAAPTLLNVLVAALLPLIFGAFAYWLGSDLWADWHHDRRFAASGVIVEARVLDAQVRSELSGKRSVLREHLRLAYTPQGEKTERIASETRTPPAEPPARAGDTLQVRYLRDEPARTQLAGQHRFGNPWGIGFFVVSLLLFGYGVLITAMGAWAWRISR